MRRAFETRLEWMWRRMDECRICKYDGTLEENKRSWQYCYKLAQKMADMRTFSNCEAGGPFKGPKLDPRPRVVASFNHRKPEGKETQGQGKGMRGKMPPFRVRAKYKGTCTFCGLPISKGEEILYFPRGGGAWHLACYDPAEANAKEMLSQALKDSQKHLLE